MADQPSNNNTDKSIASLGQRVLYFLLALWRRIENIVFVLALLFVLLYFVLQLSFIQNWLIGKVSERLSNDLQTTVRIAHVDFEFFDNLVLDGLYVADRKGDTLIYAQSLSAGLNANIFTLFSNRLAFEEISLNKARVYLKRYEGEYDSNIQFLLEYFAGNKNKPKKDKKPFPIKVRNLNLRDVVLLRDNEVRGEKMVFNIPDGNIKINNADFPSKYVHIRSAELKGLSFSYLETVPKPMPPLPKVEIQVPASDSSRKSRPMQFVIDHFAILNSTFALNNFERTPNPEWLEGVMDFDHILVEKVDFIADSIRFDSDLNFSGALKEFSAKERSGFELVKSKADKVVVNDTLTALYNTKVVTPGSTLGDTIMLHYNTYRDYRKFNNNVRMDIRLSNTSKIQLGDITKFNSKLAKNKFFKTNFETIADISGWVEGTVNKLNGRNLEIKVGKKAFMRGSFDGDDMARNPDLMRLSFNFTRLQSDIQTIKDIIPGFSPPSYFYKLGNIAFAGEYNFLFSTDHLIKGNLYTDISSGFVDMKLDLKEGRDKATYSGKLVMDRFNLKEWTGNKDFQNASFAVNIAEGSTGLSLSALKAQLQGNVDTLVYKGYTYKNIDIEGFFKEKMFDGKLKINDPNIKIKFDGNINLRDSITSYTFTSNIERIDLGALNLSDQDLVLSAKVREINLKAKKITDLIGKARIEDFALLQDGEIMHRLDSLVFISNYTQDRKYFAVMSDIATMYMEGVFDLAKISRNLQYLFVKNYPEFARQLNISTKDSIASTDDYKLQIGIKDSKNFTRLLSDHIGPLKDVKITAKVNAEENLTILGIQLPRFSYDSNYVENVDILWSGLGDRAEFSLNIPKSSVSKRILPSFEMSGSILDNELKFNLFTQKTDTSKNAIVGGLNLTGILGIAEDSLWQLRFETSRILIFNQYWGISEDNYVRFNGRRFYANNFELSNQNQRIGLRELNDNQGVFISFTNFDLSTFNPYLRPKQLKLEGVFDFDVTVQQIYSLKNIDIFLNSGTLKINNLVYGDLFGNIVAKDIKSPFWWRFFINNDETKSQLRFAGIWSNGLDSASYYVPELDTRISKDEDIRNTTTASNFPLAVVETFIPGISKTSGTFNADIAVQGKFSALKMDGSATIISGQTQLDYLKAMFHIRNQKITLTEKQIWADGAEVWDAEVTKNKAVVKGGLHHQFFKKWRIACSIESQNNRFMVLNTGPKDNELFYGQGIGKFKATFGGTFSSTDMYIKATTGPNTRLYIPLSGAADIKDSTFFVQFKQKNKQVLPKTVANNKQSLNGEIKGLNFEMDLTITPEAETQLIFDEQAGDIIRGQGVGDLRMAINPRGEFTMYGTYTIKAGEYMFTLLNFVNKPFVVSEGGTIAWSGDPYAAKINIDATYRENTSVYNLVRDELLLLESSQPELIKDAFRSTRTVVTMHLKDDLMKPTISFDLAFPDISSQLKTIIDNKLRLLSQDPNELTRQVFGLIVIGSFLPENSGFIQNGDYLASGINTLTQMLSNQLSNYLTGIASSWFGNNVSNLDFRVAYNDYQNQLSNNQGNQASRELQVQLTGGFINDRVTVRIGSQFGFAEPNTNVQDGFLGQDITIEIQPTQNRQWKLKVYQRTEPDLGGGQRRARYGAGVTFRQEYHSFNTMMADLGDWMRRRRKTM